MKPNVCGARWKARLVAGSAALCLTLGGAAAQEPGVLPEVPEGPTPTEQALEAEPRRALESEEMLQRAEQLLKTLREEPVRSIRLSLEQCVAIAIENSFDIQIDRISPLQSAEEVIAAQAEFDAAIVGGARGEGLLSVGTTRTTSPLEDVLGASETDAASAGLSVVKPLHTGGAISLGYGMRYLERDPPVPRGFDPEWRAETVLTLRQPLLRGAGLDYNLATIRISRNRREISYEEFRSQLMDVVFDVERAYWNLVRAMEDLRVSMMSLQVAIDNRQSSWLQYRAGIRPRLEVTTADAGVADRLSRLYQSEVAVRNREDQLKNAINLPDDWYIEDIHIEPLSRPREDVADPPVDLDLSRAIAIALQSRPEVRQIGLDIQTNELFERRRRNERLPQLNAEVQFSFQGVNSHQTDAARNIREGDAYEHRAGISFRYPLGNRAAQANHRSARLATRRSRLDEERVHQLIVVRVRSALRRIETDRQRVVASFKAQQLHEERLEAEQRRMEVGRSTSFEVLQVEEDYVAAQRDYVNALLDYQISLVNYDRELGTLLEMRNIEIDEIVHEGLPEQQRDRDLFR